MSVSESISQLADGFVEYFIDFVNDFTIRSPHLFSVVVAFVAVAAVFIGIRYLLRASKRVK